MSEMKALMEPKVLMSLGRGAGSEDGKVTVQQQHQERAGWKGGNPGLLQLAQERLLRKTGSPQHPMHLVASQQAMTIHHK